MPGMTTSENSRSNWPLRGLFEALPAVAGILDFAVQVAQQIAGELADLGIILDQQHLQPRRKRRRALLGGARHERSCRSVAG